LEFVVRSGVRAHIQSRVGLRHEHFSRYLCYWDSQSTYPVQSRIKTHACQLFDLSWWEVRAHIQSRVGLRQAGVPSLGSAWPCQSTYPVQSRIKTGLKQPPHIFAWESEHISSPE